MASPHILAARAARLSNLLSPAHARRKPCKVHGSLQAPITVAGSPPAPSMARRMLRLRLLFLVVAVPLGLWLLLPVFSGGAPPTLSGKIDSKRRQIERQEGRASAS